MVRREDWQNQLSSYRVAVSYTHKVVTFKMAYKGSIIEYE